jgi:hypothetical protein
MSREQNGVNQQVPIAQNTVNHRAFWTCRGEKLYWYQIYGISLRSEIKLTFPDSEPMQSADVSLLAASPDFFRDATDGAVVSPNPNRSYKYARLDNGQSYIRWDGLFEFLIDADGQRIWCGWLGAASLESLQVYLLGQALSFALVKQGYEPLHATAVVIDGQAIAFLGSSGFGKSSLAASFLAEGHRLLTDDMLLLRGTDGGYQAQPGPCRIKLFPEMAGRFLAGTASAVTMNGETEKLVLPLSADHLHSVSAPLRVLYVLGAPGELRQKQSIQLTSLSTRETFIELVRGTFNYLVTGSERLERQYTECLGVASRVPARRISYPRVLSALPDVRKAILTDLAEINRSGSQEHFSVASLRPTNNTTYRHPIQKGDS